MTQPKPSDRATVYQTPNGRAVVVNLQRSLRRTGLALVTYEDRAAEWIPENTVAQWKTVT